MFLIPSHLVSPAQLFILLVMLQMILLILLQQLLKRKDKMTETTWSDFISLYDPLTYELRRMTEAFERMKRAFDNLSNIYDEQILYLKYGI